MQAVDTLDANEESSVARCGSYWLDRSSGACSDARSGFVSLHVGRWWLPTWLPLGPEFLRVISVTPKFAEAEISSSDLLGALLEKPVEPSPRWKIVDPDQIRLLADLAMQGIIALELEIQ